MKATGIVRRIDDLGRIVIRGSTGLRFRSERLHHRPGSGHRCRRRHKKREHRHPGHRTARGDHE